MLKVIFGLVLGFVAGAMVYKIPSPVKPDATQAGTSLGVVAPDGMFAPRRRDYSDIKVGEEFWASIAAGENHRLYLDRMAYPREVRTIFHTCRVRKDTDGFELLRCTEPISTSAISDFAGWTPIVRIGRSSESRD